MTSPGLFGSHQPGPDERHRIYLKKTKQNKTRKHKNNYSSIEVIAPHSLCSDTSNRGLAEFRLNGARGFIRQSLSSIEWVISTDSWTIWEAKQVTETSETLVSISATWATCPQFPQSTKAQQVSPVWGIIFKAVEQYKHIVCSLSSGLS